MEPDDFVVRYGEVLASQQWAEVDPLIHGDASVTFSTGAVHKGKAAVRSAFEANFAAIREEKYEIGNVHWVIRTQELAVYLFDFAWSGLIDRREASGAGRGTAVLVRNGPHWQLLVEHLSALN